MSYDELPVESIFLAPFFITPPPSFPFSGRNLVFADYVKTSMFGQPTIPGSQNTTVDARGWPTQDFSLQFINEEYIWPAADLSGTYTITALGCANVSILPVFGGLTIVNQSCPNGNLLAFLDISTNGTLVNGKGALTFTETSRGPGLGAGLTNLSLLLPGYPAGTDPDTLHEPFIANMRGRCAVVRFLGWAFYGHSNYSSHDTPPTPPTWSLRPRVGDPTYFLGGWGTRGLGVPFEIIARIANAVGSDVWLNIPSSQNETERDEYVVNVLTMFDQLLPAGKRIYLEYANECFFGNNQCYHDNVGIANSTIMNKGDPYKLNLGLQTPPNASNAITWGLRMFAYTGFHFATLAHSVVGAARVGRADSPGVRVVPMIGALQSYALDGESKLSWLVAAWGSPAAVGLQTLNIGSYYGPAENVQRNASATENDVMTSMLATIAASDPAAPSAYSSHSAISSFAALSAYYGLALHAYEGGPSTAGGVRGTVGIMSLAQACQDPRMQTVVESIVRVWQQWTGGTFNYFTLGANALYQPWGGYGNRWDMKDDKTPKSAGIDAIVNSPPAALAGGWPAPLVHHNASYSVGYYTPDGLPPPVPYAPFLKLNAEFSYLVRFGARCAAGINVTVTFSCAKNDKVGGQPLEVSVGAFLPPVTISSPATDGTGKELVGVTALFDALPPAALANGLVTVRLRVPVYPVTYKLWYVDVDCRT